MEQTIVNYVRRYKKVSANRLYKYMIKKGYLDNWAIRGQLWHSVANGKLNFDSNWNVVLGDGYAAD